VLSWWSVQFGQFLVCCSSTHGAPVPHGVGTTDYTTMPHKHVTTFSCVRKHGLGSVSCRDAPSGIWALLIKTDTGAALPAIKHTLPNGQTLVKGMECTPPLNTTLKWPISRAPCAEAFSRPSAQSPTIQRCVRRCTDTRKRCARVRWTVFVQFILHYTGHPFSPIESQLTSEVAFRTARRTVSSVFVIVSWLVSE